jgi:hypothetical protein
MIKQSLEHVYIDFSKRQVTIKSDQGEFKTVQWKWDREGSEGFSETVSTIESITDISMRTYCFSEQ